MTMPNSVHLRYYDVDSWHEFKTLAWELFEGVRLGDGAMWFRGQGDVMWPLESSFDRSVKDRLDSERRSRVLQHLETGLAERLGLLDDWGESYRFDDMDPSQLMAIAQHHGCLTRLLDWTLSPYIAAFFAFSDLTFLLDDEGDDGQSRCAVWAIDTNASCWAHQPGVSLLSLQHVGNRRLQRQQGVFTLNTSEFASLETFCSHYYTTWPAQADALVRISLPRHIARTAVKDLELMGISSESMFPGVEGASRYALVQAILGVTG